MLLESEWVLRAGYGFRAADVLRFFRSLLGLPGVSTGDPARIAQAFDGYAAGLDLADALHLALSGEAGAFATFDARPVRRAQRLPGPKVVAP